MKRGLIALATVVALALPANALASQIVSDKNVVAPTLKVNTRGIALLQYKTEAGAARNVLYWGAINAVPNSDVGQPQQKFQVDYSGGWKSQKNANYWKKFKNACKPYDGPALQFFVTGCKAPDGSYWALQSWQRNLPMRGFDPWTAQQKAYELHISHWSGPLPVLDITMAWTYEGAQQGFFGRLLYSNQPVYGTRSPSPTVADPYARNISIDTLDSDYGPGWKHDTQINPLPKNGAFCYTFVPQAPPRGYPSSAPRGNGLGTRIRVIVMGPGVTPIVTWEGSRLPGSFNSAANEAARKHFDAILAGDRHCAPERPS